MTKTRLALLGSAAVATIMLAGAAEYLQRTPIGAPLKVAHETPNHLQRLAQTDPNGGAPSGTQIQQSEIDEEQAEQQQQPPPPPPPPPPQGG